MPRLCSLTSRTFGARRCRRMSLAHPQSARTGVGSSVTQSNNSVRIVKSGACSSALQMLARNLGPLAFRVEFDVSEPMPVSFAEAARFFQKHRHIEMRIRIFWRDRYRGLQAADRLRQFAALLLHVREVVPGGRKCRILRRRHAKALFRAIGITHLAQHVAQIEVGFRAARRNRQAFTIRGNRFLMTLMFFVLLADLEPFLRGARVLAKLDNVCAGARGGIEGEAELACRRNTEVPKIREHRM